MKTQRDNLPVRWVKAANPIEATIASSGSHLSGLSPYVMSLPAASLLSLMHKGQSKDRVGQSVITDMGRGVGSFMGLAGALGMKSRFGLNLSPLANRALMMGGVGGGAVLGHLKGKAVGEQLFPGTLMERLRRAAERF